jgi:hypothetical protein
VDPWEHYDENLLPVRHKGLSWGPWFEIFLVSNLFG